MSAAVRSRYLLGLRRHWPSWLLLAVLAGLGAGLALGAITDARRTWTAVPRAATLGRASELDVSGNTTTIDSVQAATYADAVRDLPDVAAATRTTGFDLERVRPDGTFDPALRSGHALGFVSTPEIGGRLNRSRVVHGRLPAPDRDDEIAINAITADLTGWRVGDQITDLELFRVADMEDLEPVPGKGIPLRLRVVGVVRPVADLVADADAIPRVLLSDAFATKHPDSSLYLIESVALRSGRGGIPAFRAEAQRLGAAQGVDAVVTVTADGIRSARAGLRPQVVALWLLGVVVLVVTALVTAQALGRQMRAHLTDQPELRALGMTRRQRRTLGAVHGATVAAGAAVFAVATAVVLSAFTPIGSARAFEWDRGVLLDGPALAIGGATIFLLLSAAAVVPAVRLARRAEQVPGIGHAPSAGERPSRVVGLIAGTGAPPPLVVGVRMALQPGRGNTTSPVRSVMTSIALAVGLVVATAVFAADLDHVVSTPRLYGTDWDASVGTTFGRIPDEAVGELERLPDVAAVSGLALGSLHVEGIEVPAWGVDLVKGTVFPTLDDGRLPQSPVEVVLGRKTAHRLGVGVGDAVTVRPPDGRAVDMTVVGLATFPRLGLQRYRETSLGEGVATVASVLGPGDGAGRYNYDLVRFDAARRDGALSRLRARVAELGCTDNSCVLTDLRPTVLGAYGRLRGIWGPALFALAALLAMTLAHGLVTSVRARREELAVLRALGLTSRQTRSVVVWEALTLAFCGLLIGIPLGVAGASAAWLAFSRSVGIEPTPAEPARILVTVGLGVLLAAGVVGVLCSVEAARSRRSIGIPGALSTG